MYMLLLNVPCLMTSIGQILLKLFLNLNTLIPSYSFEQYNDLGNSNEVLIVPNITSFLLRKVATILD